MSYLLCPGHRSPDTVLLVVVCPAESVDVITYLGHDSFDTAHPSALCSAGSVEAMFLFGHSSLDTARTQLSRALFADSSFDTALPSAFMCSAGSEEAVLLDRDYVYKPVDCTAYVESTHDDPFAFFAPSASGGCFCSTQWVQGLGSGSGSRPDYLAARILGGYFFRAVIGRGLLFRSTDRNNNSKSEQRGNRASGLLWFRVWVRVRGWVGFTTPVP